jgi:RimJ/RimL family protein N-acetyltransferase
MPHRFFIQTPRVRLREFGLDDVHVMTAMHREPRIRALLIDDYPLDDAAQALPFIDALSRIYRSHEGYGIWHCECKVVGSWDFCGWFNLLPIQSHTGTIEPGVAEIGCRLLPMAWGTGVQHECARAVLDHAFGPLALRHVSGYCHPDNRSAKLALLALGFRAQGLLEHQGALASYFLISPVQWAAAGLQSRQQLLRQALKTLRASEPLPA